MANIGVLGCGVSGLTTALVLAEQGHRVSITAEQLPFDTVSVVAGAIWAPSMVEPQSRVPAWALRTREVLVDLADDAATGVAPMVHVDLKHTDPGHVWGEDTPWVTRMPPEQLPPGCAAALVIDGFRIDPPIYLRWLIDRFESTGGSIDLCLVSALDDIDGDVVVNCAGLGSVELAGDTTMYPIRGHVVAVPNPGIVEGIANESDQDRIGYVYPRTTELVLGGTRQEGLADPNPDPATRDRILADAAQLDPRVTDLPVITERVGLRPGRPEVRLERDTLPDGRMVIHNYGHGGAGYIMSWGCAEEVATLVATAVR